jgi:hypothetical protein
MSTVPTLRRAALRKALFALLILTGATLVLLTASALLGGAAVTPVSDPLAWLTALDRDTAAATLSGAAQIVAGVLGIAITVVAIVVQLAATRSGNQITEMFVGEPINRAIMVLFVLTTLQCLWISVTFRDGNAAAVLPNGGFAITMALITISLLILLPYFQFLFAFLSPLYVIEQLRERANTAMRAAINGAAESSQRVVANRVDDLEDVARSAIEQSDRGVAIACVDALADLLNEYQTLRESLPADWFRLGAAIQRDPDFGALPPSSLAEIEQSGLWVEVKVLRQYFALMIHSVPQARDVADLIAINTRRIGTGAAGAQPELVEQCIRCFNSYLLETIKAGDMRTGVYVLNQYRLFAEALLATGRLAAVREIAGFFQYYGVHAHTKGQSFILVVAAYDIVQLIEAAAAIDSPVVDDLLSRLLELDQDIKQESQESSLLGVRKAQIQLATLFIERNDEARARRIAADLAVEPPERLARIRAQLLTEDRTQYWEFTPRGVNFGYLLPERRKHLTTLFGWLAVT